MIISRSFLFRMRNVSDKSCRENQNTHFVFSNFFFENRAVYEIMEKNNVEPDRPQMTVWRMRIAFCVPKATNTCSEYVIIIAFQLQQWLHARSSILRYTCTACLLVCWLWTLLRPVQRAWERYEDLTAAWLRIWLFWDMTLCRCVNSSRRFGGM